jgi:hypothetical protein
MRFGSRISLSEHRLKALFELSWLILLLIRIMMQRNNSFVLCRTQGRRIFGFHRCSAIFHSTRAVRERRSTTITTRVPTALTRVRPYSSLMVPVFYSLFKRLSPWGLFPLQNPNERLNLHFVAGGPLTLTLNPFPFIERTTLIPRKIFKLPPINISRNWLRSRVFVDGCGESWWRICYSAGVR